MKGCAIFRVAFNLFNRLAAFSCNSVDFIGREPFEREREGISGCGRLLRPYGRERSLQPEPVSSLLKRTGASPSCLPCLKNAYLL